MKELIQNLDKLKTTELGKLRIERNLLIDNVDIIGYIKDLILSPKASITRQGKNFYVENEKIIITINAYSYTIITAHRVK